MRKCRLSPFYMALAAVWAVNAGINAANNYEWWPRLLILLDLACMVGCAITAVLYYREGR